MSVEGRSNDFIMFPNGQYIPPAPLAWSTVVIPGIKNIFFLQHEDYSLDIFVVKEEKADSGKIIKGIVKRIKDLSKDKKDKLKYRITFKTHIDRKSNKFRTVETKVASWKRYLLDKE